MASSVREPGPRLILFPRCQDTRRRIRANQGCLSIKAPVPSKAGLDFAWRRWRSETPAETPPATGLLPGSPGPYESEGASSPPVIGGSSTVSAATLRIRRTEQRQSLATTARPLRVRADISAFNRDVCFVPIADIRTYLSLLALTIAQTAPSCPQSGGRGGGIGV